MTKLIFLHGLGDDATAWETTLVQPELDEFEKVAVEVPGFGGRIWNGETMFDTAEIVWNEHGGEQTVVVGHSMGGTLATLIAERQPQGLLGIVNVDGNLTEAGAFLSSRAVAAHDFDNWWTRFVPKQEPRYQAALRRCDPDAFLAYSHDLFGVSRDNVIGERYKALDSPKLYIHGGDRLEVIEHFVKGQNAVGLPTGHWVMEDQPSQVAALIRDFARELNPG